MMTNRLRAAFVQVTLCIGIGSFFLFVANQYLLTTIVHNAVITEMGKFESDYHQIAWNSLEEAHTKKEKLVNRKGQRRTPKTKSASARAQTFSDISLRRSQTSVATHSLEPHFKGSKRSQIIDAELIEVWLSRIKVHIEQIRKPANETDLGSQSKFVRIRKRPRIRLYAEDGGGKQDRSGSAGSASKETQAIPPMEACQVIKKWVVMTSIAPEPTRTMRMVLEEGWCLVVVALQGSPKMFPKIGDPRFVYLSIGQQYKLPFQIVSLTPEDSLSRRNIGYLYAMSQGAEVILDLDDDCEPIAIDVKGAMLPVERDRHAYERPMLYLEELEDKPGESPVWNPYLYFNLTHAWPRGFPWEHLETAKRTDYSVVRNQTCLPVIQQFLLGLDPDLDAAYRIATNDAVPEGYAGGKGFKKFVSPRNVFVPYNSKATVHLKDVFWAMLLPTTVDGRVADIWRSYIAQSLLYFLPDACVMYTSAAVQRQRKHGIKKSDIMHEIPMYSASAALIDVLRNLPMKVDNIPSALEKAYKLLYETGFLESQDVEYARAWLGDLKTLAVKIPSVPSSKKLGSTWMQETQVCLMFNNHPNWRKNWPYVVGELATKYVHFFPNIVVLLDRETFQEPDTIVDDSGRISSDFLSDFVNVDHWPSEISWYSCKGDLGFRQNRCLKKCMEVPEGRNKAALYMADDDFINFTRAHESVPREKIWFPKISHWAGGPFDEHLYDNYTAWSFTDDLYEAMKVLKQLPDDVKSEYLDHVNATGQVEGHCLSDCAYVPSAYRERLVGVIDDVERLQPEFFSEAGMPLAINLVAPGDRKYAFDPDYVLWGSDRTDVVRLAEGVSAGMHLHPLKLSLPVARVLWRDAMAEMYRKML